MHREVIYHASEDHLPYIVKSSPMRWEGISRREGRIPIGGKGTAIILKNVPFVVPLQ